MSPSKVSPADFQVLKVVGQGAFGKVIVCCRKSPRELQLDQMHFQVASSICNRAFGGRRTFTHAVQHLRCARILDHSQASGPCACCLQVFQVRKRDTGRIYAMKVMRKVSPSHARFQRVR